MSENDDEHDSAFDHLDPDHPSRERAYEVGKYRPPSASRIKPGERRNPKGRPRAQKEPADLLKAFYMEKIKVRVGDKTVRMQRIVAEAHILNSKALSGDIRALKESRALAQSAGVFVESLEPAVTVVDGQDEAILNDYIARRLGMPAGGSTPTEDDDHEKG